MPIYQSYNKKNKAWVKYELYKGTSKIIDMKQREPQKKFKGIKVR